MSLWSFYTWVVLNQLLQRVKLSSGSDVVAATIQFADLIMFDVIAFDIVPVPYGQGEGTCGERWRFELDSFKQYKLMDKNLIKNKRII